MEKPSELAAFCHTCSEGLSGLEDNASRIAFVTSLLQPLLDDRALFIRILENVVRGLSYPDVRYPTMFDNELILHLDPAGHFSLRLYLWNPKEFDSIHDHNSWGVIGPVTGRLKVRDFVSRSEEEPASAAGITESGVRIITAGSTYPVLPLDAGIHQTGNPTESVVIQASIYGKKQTDRPFVNLYDEISGRVYPLYSPPVRKRLLAEQALADL